MFEKAVYVDPPPFWRLFQAIQNFRKLIFLYFCLSLELHLYSLWKYLPRPHWSRTEWQHLAKIVSNQGVLQHIIELKFKWTKLQVHLVRHKICSAPSGKLSLLCTLFSIKLPEPCCPTFILKTDLLVRLLLLSHRGKRFHVPFFSCAASSESILASRNQSLVPLQLLWKMMAILLLYRPNSMRTRQGLTFISNQEIF